MRDSMTWVFLFKEGNIEKTKSIIEKAARRRVPFIVIILCYNKIVGTNNAYLKRRMTMLFERSFIKPESIMDAAAQETASMRDMRIMRAQRSERGWLLKYITLDDDYPIAAIERSLTRKLGEAVSMVNLHYDFDTAARLIYA